MPQFDVTIAGELNLDLILYGLPAELPEERELLATFWECKSELVRALIRYFPRLRLELKTTVSWREDVEVALERLLGSVSPERALRLA